MAFETINFAASEVHCWIILIEKILFRRRCHRSLLLEWTDFNKNQNFCFIFFQWGLETTYFIAKILNLPSTLPPKLAARVGRFKKKLELCSSFSDELMKRLIAQQAKFTVEFFKLKNTLFHRRCHRSSLLKWAD